MTIRGHVPPPPVPVALLDGPPPREHWAARRRPKPPRVSEAPAPAGALSVLTPAGQSSHAVRPRVDAALARLATPRPSTPSPRPVPRAPSVSPVRPGRAPSASAVPRGTSLTLAYRRRPPRPLVERLGASPDRFAMWAVVMGVLLVVVAMLSGPS